VIAALLCARLAALPPLKLVICVVIDRGAGVDKAVNHFVHVACEDLRAPHLAR